MLYDPRRVAIPGYLRPYCHTKTVERGCSVSKHANLAPVLEQVKLVLLCKAQSLLQKFNVRRHATLSRSKIDFPLLRTATPTYLIRKTASQVRV
jgi:hypothetical protein